MRPPGGDELVGERRPYRPRELRVPYGVVLLSQQSRRPGEHVGRAGDGTRWRRGRRRCGRLPGPPAGRRGQASHRAGRPGATVRRLVGEAGGLVSTQARMLGYWVRSTSRSPKRWYSVHGTSTATSPQTAAGVRPKTSEQDVGHDQRRHAVAPGELLGGEVAQPASRACPSSRRGRRRWARRPGCRRSSRGVRRAAGSRSGCRGSCRACPTRRSRAAGSPARVGALEPAGARHVGVQDDRCRRRPRSSSPGQLVDLGVAEAVEGEAGVPTVSTPSPAQRVACRWRRPSARA